MIDAKKEKKEKKKYVPKPIEEQVAAAQKFVNEQVVIADGWEKYKGQKGQLIAVTASKRKIQYIIKMTATLQLACGRRDFTFVKPELNMHIKTSNPVRVAKKNFGIARKAIWALMKEGKPVTQEVVNPISAAITAYNAAVTVK